MAQRFDGNPDYFIKEISTNDIVPGTHKSGSGATDIKVTLGQEACIPVFSCSTGSATANKSATILNNSIFAAGFSLQHPFQRNETTQTEYLLGMAIKVVFSNANTADSPTLNAAGTGVYPITVNGVKMGAGALGAGAYKFRLIPYGNSYSWDCEDNGGVISIINGVITYSDGSTAYNKQSVDNQINGALANYAQGKRINLRNYEFSQSGVLSALNTEWEQIKNNGVYSATFNGGYAASITVSNGDNNDSTIIVTNGFNGNQRFYYRANNAITENAVVVTASELNNYKYRMKTQGFSINVTSGLGFAQVTFNEEINPEKVAGVWVKVNRPASILATLSFVNGTTGYITYHANASFTETVIVNMIIKE